MPATVTLTGTGVPFPQPGRAGPGVLVRRGDIALQVDAGRATTLRMAEAGIFPHELSAVLITHVHSDHVADLPDIAMTRWLRGGMYSAGPLIVVAPEGGAGHFVESMLDPYAADPVPLEYSIGYFTCIVADMMGAVVVGLLDAAQGRLGAGVPGTRPGVPR
jgi:ribonuclease Z